ncbi:MAG: hypothetical protein HYZ75_18670 [Elusimicrobia bacterium]|nr:hypothetical protein [Elusimicrobiota bacterium]
MSTGKARIDAAAQGGFTLVELILAVFLSTMVLTAMMGVQQFATRGQSNVLARVRLNGHAVYALESVRRSVYGASTLVVPSTGAVSTLLTGHENVDPLDGSPLDAAAPLTYFHFCLTDAAPKSLYRYAGELPVPAITCGQAPPSGAFELIAGQPGGTPGDALAVNVLFSRVSGAKNLLEYQYSLSYPKNVVRAAVESRGVTQIATQEALE